MNELQSQLESVLAEVVAYNDKPTKACSGRIRKQLGELKKNVTGVRKTLVEADAKGYK